jgi:hypothetical protein
MAPRTGRLAYALVLCIASFVAAASDDYAVVNKDFAKVMQSPYGDAAQVGLAKKGDHYKIRYEQGEWFCVEQNGIVGWIYSGNISIEHAPESALKAAKQPVQPAAAEAAAPQNKTPEPKTEQSPSSGASATAATGEKQPSATGAASVDGALPQNKNLIETKKDGAQKNAAFSVADVKTKKKPSPKPIAPVIIRADPTESIAPEIIAVADSLQKKPGAEKTGGLAGRL